jgi:putative DNA primase/helicase
MLHMQFTEMLDRFTGVSEQDDGGYLAHCPAHADSKPSLRLWRGDDNKVRITCRAGCSTGAVIQAVGLTWSDLFNAEGDGATVPKERPAMVGIAHIAGLQSYVDIAGQNLRGSGSRNADHAARYAAHRFGITPAMFEDLELGLSDDDTRATFPYLSRAFLAFPRLVVPLCDFDGTVRGLQGRDLTGECPGRWVSLSNPQGHRWAPYGVFRGQGGYGVTLITEGPGDGLTAVAVGYDVVMVRGAALAGSPELLAEIAEGVRGTQVIACGDADKSGQDFNQKLADGLKAHGIEVYALPLPTSLPNKGDLTDWRALDPDAFPWAIHNAIKAARPVAKPEEARREAVSVELNEATGADTVSRDQGSEAGRILASVMERYGESDAMNAHALVAWTDGRIKYAPGLGFYVWNGRTWERSEVKVRQEIHRMGAALVLAGKLQESKGFTMTTRIDALMTELRSVPSVYVAVQDFDNRPDLLSFRNGTVELRTGHLRPHAKQDMLTYCLALDYDAAAQAPRWEAFLQEIMPGMPEMPAYLQRLIGYGVTGNTDEQCFAVLWGKGANGKSVLTETLSSVFGNVTKTTPFATFEEKQSGGIPNDIAALRGARLVMASEGESGKPMSEAVLKRVTGKDMVSARFLRQEFFEFRPSFLLMLATNHKPKFRGQDDGLWRRVKMIPFKRFFAPHERDYDLDSKLRAEAQGIAAWAVRGAVEWYSNGLQDPSVITAASREYRETSDALVGFFPGVFERDESHSVPGADAYNAYREWCEAEGLPSKEIWTRRSFYDAMEERQVSRKKTNKGITLVGIRPADAATKATGPGIFGKD